MSTRQRYTITLEEAPSGVPLWDSTPGYRLKLALKRLWRVYSLRCTGVVDVPQNAGDANQRQGEGNDDHNTNSRTSGRKALR